MDNQSKPNQYKTDLNADSTVYFDEPGPECKIIEGIRLLRDLDQERVMQAQDKLENCLKEDPLCKDIKSVICKIDFIHALERQHMLTETPYMLWISEDLQLPETAIGLIRNLRIHIQYVPKQLLPERQAIIGSINKWCNSSPGILAHDIERIRERILELVEEICDKYI